MGVAAPGLSTGGPTQRPCKWMPMAGARNGLWFDVDIFWPPPEEEPLMDVIIRRW